MRPLTLVLSLALAVAFALAAPARADGLRCTPENLPPGASVEWTRELGPSQVSAFGSKLGARVVALSNQAVVLGGLRAQVNVVTCASEEDAARALEGLRALKDGRSDGLGRAGVSVIEVTKCVPLLGKRLLASLGAPPPGPVTYGATFRAACLDGLDYMQANAVTNLFLVAPDAAVTARLRELTASFKPGRTLRLLSGGRPHVEATFKLAPEPARTSREGDIAVHIFERPPARAGVPYVEVEARISVRPAYAPFEGPPPGPSLTRATERWPATASAIVERARRVTEKFADPLARIAAVLSHVRESIRYDGPMGTRWGVERALAQGYGRCWDMSDAFVTLCRAAGIPARQLGGWGAAPALGSGHIWAEAYIEGKGWIPVDATTPWLGTSEDYVPWYATDDGEMPVVYIAIPELKRVE